MIEEVSLMPFWLKNGNKSDFNASSDIPFNLAYKIAENHFRNNVSSPLLIR